MRAWPWPLVLSPLLVHGATASQGEEFERVDLRVISPPDGGRVRVDHGASDGLEVGVMVLFFPREGGTFGGTLIEVLERSAVVELLDPEAEVATGTKGQALLPRAAEEEQAEEEQAAEAEQLEDLPWKNADADWRPSMPLLGRTRSVKPADRDSRITGRIWLSADSTFSSFEDRSDSFYRFGQDVSYENPFGQGGALEIDLEQNQRQLDLGDGDPDNRSEVRVDRLSYAFGGDRFRATRFEGGRFLSHGMPEFGVVDGAEVGHRLSNGDRIGASVGYLPEPGDNFESGEDFQLSTYSRWVADEDERFTISGGYQKTLHDEGSDRDLFVVKSHYLPIDDWRWHGTAWIDHYTGSDERSGVELTQAQLMAQRTWESGNGMTVSYDRRSFPEIEREEFGLVTGEELSAARHDRLSVRTWRHLSGDRKLHGHLAGWDDQEESGADGSIGLELRDFWIDEGRTDFTLFGNEGRYESIVGARIGLGRDDEDGSWWLSYEAAKADVQGGLLSSDDDLFQHKLHGRHDWYFDSGWILSGYADVFLWDEENAWSLGFHMQRSF